MNVSKSARSFDGTARSALFRGFAVLTAGGLVAKGVGALYRIRLSGLLGGYGMGLYQMAYPLFCLFLTLSSAGVPTALARAVARERADGRESGGTVRAALLLFAALGAVGSLLMCLFAPAMGRVQGEEALLLCYLFLAPAVLFVALLSVLRGYFQGMGRMAPTALSEIVEQLFKAGLGLLFAWRCRDDPLRAVEGALLAVTLSEAAALLFLCVEYRASLPRRTLRVVRPTDGIFRSVLPVMVSAALLPLSQTADSVIVVRLLARHTARAVSQYGLLAGGAASLVNLPATVSYGLAAVAVPAVAAGEGEEGRRRALSVLFLTLLVAIPCAAGLFLFARPAVRILYPALVEEDAETLVSLLRLLSVSAATLAGVNTLSACLAGMGRAKNAAFAMFVAVLVKTGLQFVLVNASLAVGGAAIAVNACYMVAFFLDLFYTVRKTEVEHDHGDRTWRRARRRDGAGAPRDAGGG